MKGIEIDEFFKELRTAGVEDDEEEDEEEYFKKENRRRLRLFFKDVLECGGPEKDCDKLAEDSLFNSKLMLTSHLYSSLMRVFI